MKTFQCAQPRHHHNGFVVTYQLWMANGGIHALLVSEPTSAQEAPDKEHQYII